MKIIKQKYTINSTPQKVWDALTNPKIIEKWSGAKAVMTDKEGTKFKLWDNEIFGTNIKVTPIKKLVQEWYTDTMIKPSLLTFNIKRQGNKTIVELIHENVPEDEFDDIKSGWKDYYMNPLKKLVEKS